MNRIIRPWSSGVESQEGDSILAPVRGWPTGSYNPSSPGSTFNTWNANSGVRVSSTNFFTVSRVLTLAGTSNGSFSSRGTIWIPPTSLNRFAILETVVCVNGINISKNFADFSSANSFSLSVNISSAAVQGTQFFLMEIPNSDPGWTDTDPTVTWAPDDVIGPSGHSGMSMGRGFSSAGIPSGTVNRLDYGVGQETQQGKGVYNSSTPRGFQGFRSQAVGGFTADRFTAVATYIQSPSALYTANVTVYLICASLT